jgi:hypothetical protein
VLPAGRTLEVVLLYGRTAATASVAADGTASVRAVRGKCTVMLMLRTGDRSALLAPPIGFEIDGDGSAPPIEWTAEVQRRLDEQLGRGRN